MHFHVGLCGDQHPDWGGFSDQYREENIFKIFLWYVGLKENEINDQKLRQKTEEIITESKLDQIVCLALDPVFSESGIPDRKRSNVWVDNDYVIDLRRTIGDKVLLGASIHPYDPEFKTRLEKYADQGAVLLKWLPSAQQINLADERVKDAIISTAKVRNGKPLPILLHVGPEYAIPPIDSRAKSYDYLSWSKWENFINNFRGKKKWHRPQIDKIHSNLEAGLEEGAIIIFAHCGLPYFAPKLLKKVVEHSDFKSVRKYLQKYPVGGPQNGQCFTDVSACATPFRKDYFSDIEKLSPNSLLFGSDYPTPVFELSADLPEVWRDFKAILKGKFERIIIPQGNLLDVNYSELNHAFPNHKMFTNFNSLI